MKDCKENEVKKYCKVLKNKDNKCKGNKIKVER